MWTSPKKTNMAITINAIYLCTNTNLQGGHKLMNIATGRLITQPKVFPCVTTKISIEAVEKLAESKGFKTLIFQSQEEGNYFS